MNHRKFAEEYPEPLPLSRGDRIPVTFNVSKDEHEIMLEIVDNAKAVGMFGGIRQNYLRWLVAWGNQAMLGLVGDATFKPLATMLAQQLKTHNMEVALEHCEEFVRHNARQVVILWESNLTTEALKEYSKLLETAHNHQFPTSAVLTRFIHENLDLQRFREKLAVSEWADELANIERQWQDN